METRASTSVVEEDEDPGFFGAVPADETGASEVGAEVEEANAKGSTVDGTRAVDENPGGVGDFRVFSSSSIPTN